MVGSVPTIGGVVLCGGRSRRMGAPKAWLPCGEEYLLQRVVRIVSGVVRPVVVAARRDQELPPLPQDVLVAHDVVEDGGPLAGIAAGFDALAGRCDAVVVASCDHPLLKPSFINRLIELLEDHPAVVPGHEEHVYALTAVYRLDTASVLARLLAQSIRRVRDFVDCCDARVVPASQFEDVDPTLDSLSNVNDPETYENLMRILSG